MNDEENRNRESSAKDRHPRSLQIEGVVNCFSKLLLQPAGRQFAETKQDKSNAHGPSWDRKKLPGMNERLYVNDVI